MRLKDSLFLNGAFLAIEWQVVARQQIARSLRGAGQIPHHVAACDRANANLTKEEYSRLLQMPSTTKMGRMMRMSPFHVGARAPAAPYGFAQDAPGAVVGVDYHTSENTEWVGNPASNVGHSRVVAIRYLPRAIHVAFDDHIPRETDNSPGTDFGNGHAQASLP